MPAAVIVIPARFASTRFPGKPLLKQSGKFLIQHVVEQARRARRASAVIVATDDERIRDAVLSFGGLAVMTSHTHPSGTDRIAEVMRRPEYGDTRVVVNVQGDEPEIEPAIIDALIEVTLRPEVGMATVSAPFEHLRDVDNPNHVKVVTDRDHFALYFSRATIPFPRDRAAGAGVPSAHAGLYRLHLGIYAYKRETLLALAEAPQCEMERVEKLEQLRALHMGIRMYVQETDRAPHGVDTPEDYAAFLKRIGDSQKEHA